MYWKDIKKPSKYHNERWEVDGEAFDSKREAKRWGELKLLEKAGEIRDLRRQVPYELIPPQYVDGKCVERATAYKADFVYTENGQTVVEDAKGCRTEVYKLKKKLMRWRYGIEVREV